MKNAKNLYAVFLRLYPLQYRQEFEAQMMQTFLDCYADVRDSAKGTRLLFWWSFTVDELRNIFKQRTAFLEEDGHFLRLSNTKRTLTALLFLPIFVLLFAALVKVSLALPHPTTTGVGVVLAFVTLLTVAALWGVATGYVIVSALLNGFARLKTS